jgi:hypothetical protein
VVPRQDLTDEPASLDDARRGRQGAARRRASDAQAVEAELGQPYVAATDVVALLNRVGECVRALPSFGRTRTQTAAVVAKRTLSAISTCSPAGLADHDDLRPVLARLGATRGALRDTALSGAQQIAAVRWFGQLTNAGDAPVPESEQAAEFGPPAHTYVIRSGQLLRELDEDLSHDLTDSESCDERIHDLARAGALIAAEIDRLQQRQQLRYA